MTFDEILDFLFHRILGIFIMIAATVLLVLGLSSCLPLDFCACFWQCGGCTDCAQTCASCSSECDDVCYDCFGGSNTGKSSCALNDCLFGPSGCETECGDCYVDCGGVNYSLFQTVCFDDGCGEGCHESSNGYQRFSCMNCIAYCEGTKDPGSPNYQRIFLFNLKIVDYYGEESSMEFYENTDYIPYKTISGLAFKGYYTARDGQGTRITNENGTIIAKPSKGATVYPYYRNAFEGVEFNFNIWYPGYASDTGEIFRDETFEDIVSGADLSTLLPAPKVIEGYTFKSWRIYTSEKEVGNEDGFYSNYLIFNPADYGFSADSIGFMGPEKRVIDIIAHYEKKTCEVTIKFPEDLGYSDKSFTDEYGKLLYEVAHPYTAEGKKFVGFSYDEYGDGGILDKETTILDSSVIIVYAIYKDIVTLTFKEEGIKEYTVEYYDGETAVLPQPKKEIPGMKFVGWNFTTSFTPVYTTLVISTSHNGKILEPNFEKATYTITYKSEGTLIGTDQYTMGSGKALRTMDVPYQTFKGWKNTENNKTYTTTLPNDVYGDLTLEAVYTPKTYTVTLQPNGGTISTYTQTVTYGQAFTLPIPRRSDRTFKGWSYSNGHQDILITDSNGRSLPGFEYTKYSGATFSGELDLTVKAVWNENEYKVNFVSNGTTVHEITVTHGSTVNAPSDPTLKGHDFVGWYVGTKAFDFSTAITSNTTITAKFNPKTYTLVFEVGNSASWDDSPNKQITVSYTYGTAKITLPDTPIHNNGFTLAGWYSAPNGQGTFVIAPNGQVLNIDAIITQSTTYTLYAYWTD